MSRLLRCLKSHLPLALVLIASIAAWLPLVLAGQTAAVAATIPTPDQRVEPQFSADLAADGSSGPLDQQAPHFNALCESETGLWAQTLTVGMTSRLSEVELLLLRRSPDIHSPVEVEVREVDDAGRPSETVLARGMTEATIPFHRAAPGWLTIRLEEPVLLLRGQKVAIFPTSRLSDSGTCYEWTSAGLDTYGGGAIAVTFDAGATFALEGGQDAGFRTWTR
jgi:hypothetical protein